MHISELCWQHIDHPGDVVKVGEQVTVEVLDIDTERQRVSLSLKATQENPWQQFARTHAIGQIVPVKVTKLVPFGAFVLVEQDVEGLVHISELAQRHIESPEQVVHVGDDLLVKVIDIDPVRRRISLSLKRADDEFVDADEHFDPVLYGMVEEYDEQGNYTYPEGFDPESKDWLPGYERQQDEWEQQYMDARDRWERHRQQVHQNRAQR